jgi:hypothetical protein
MKHNKRRRRRRRRREIGHVRICVAYKASRKSL